MSETKHKEALPIQNQELSSENLLRDLAGLPAVADKKKLNLIEVLIIVTLVCALALAGFVMYKKVSTTANASKIWKEYSSLPAQKITLSGEESDPALCAFFISRIQKENFTVKVNGANPFYEGRSGYTPFCLKAVKSSPTKTIDITWSK